MNLVITVRRVLPDARNDGLPDAAVHVIGERVVAVGPRELVVPPALAMGATPLDFPAGTAMPGLVDAHVHLGLGEPAGIAERARALLTGGVTTARDLGDPRGVTLQLRREIDAGRLAGPRLLCAGTPLTGTPLTATPLTGTPLTGTPLAAPDSGDGRAGPQAQTEHEIRGRVRHTASLAVDLIAVLTSSGQAALERLAGGQARPAVTFSQPQLRWIIREATARGLAVAVQADRAEAIENALRAGASTIVQCTGTAPGREQRPREHLAAELAARGITVCPVISCDPGDSSGLQQHLAWLHDHGVQLIPGSGTGLAGGPASGDLVSTLRRYERLGFSRRWILGAATTDAARALRPGLETGRVAPGQLADLIVVDGDPLAGLEALRSVRLALVRGRAYPTP